MHHLEGLGPFVIILAMASLVVGVFHRLRLPTIAGFLVTGVLIGPGFGAFIEDRSTVEMMAELGVILLMFTIGLEFSVREMWRMRRLVFGGGVAQMVITGVVFGTLVFVAGRSWNEAVVWGAALSLSSTAIVLKLLGDGGRLGTPHGRAVLGILLLQDVAVVLLMLMLPVLAGDGAPMSEALFEAGLSMFMVLVLLGGASLAFPVVLKWVVKTRDQELFRVVTMLTILGTAFLAGEFGLSLALGAFIAGMVVADSPYSHQMHAEILPLRDVFNGVFFVSVGMLFDGASLMENAGLSLALFLGVTLGKGVVGALAARVAGVRGREAWMAGVSVAQVGEFAFVMASAGLAAGLVQESDHRIFVNVAVLSMLTTPAVLAVADRIFARTTPARGFTEEDRQHVQSDALNDHVVVIGYGPSGQNVVRVLRQLGVSFVVIEQNAQTVAALRAAGDQAIYGDATQSAVLKFVGMERARALVVTIASASAARGIVVAARSLNANARIIARTRFVQEVPELVQLGADHVVPEEFETSLELTSHVMEAYGVGPGAVERERAMLRAEYHESMMGGRKDREIPRLSDLMLHIDTEAMRLSADDGAVGMCLRDLDLRRHSGVTVLSVVRDGQVVSSGLAELTFEADDTLVMFGHGDQIQAASAVLRDPQIRHTQRLAAIRGND
jgi:CPA2 family monovalent cation:H+ antiporter-2